MEPAQIAVMLASPVVVAVVGVLLWWRVGQVEKEMQQLRDMQLDVAMMKGAVDALKELVSDVLHAALGRRGSAARQSGDHSHGG